MPTKAYYHSRCCNAHWELVSYDGDMTLECEKCGARASNELTLTFGNKDIACDHSVTSMPVCKECGEEIDDNTCCMCDFEE